MGETIAGRWWCQVLLLAILVTLMIFQIVWFLQILPILADFP
jgi:hypothetical protein